MVDNEDGTYTVTYRSDEELPAVIEIFYINEDKEHERIRNWRHQVTFSKKTTPKNNELTGPLMQSYVVAELKRIG